MKRILCALLVVSGFCAQAMELTQENKREIHACWGRIFDKELPEIASQEEVKKLKGYRKRLLNIQDEDAAVAGQLIAQLCKGNLWDRFMAEKSVDATLAYIDFLVKALNLFIARDMTFSFPLRLHDICAYVHDSGSDIKEVCAQMRQAFLAFTIIVSKMDYLTRQ